MIENPERRPTDTEPFTGTVVVRGNCSKFGPSVIERDRRPFGIDRSSRSGEKPKTF